MTSETNLQFASTGPMMNANLNPTSSLPGQPNLLSGSFSSMSQPASSHQQPSSGSISSQQFSLKLSNVPADLSEREAQLIFALVNDDIASVELKDQVITAVFKSLNTCITTGKLLEHKPIFGENSPQVNVEYDANVSMATTSSAFNNMRLSTSGISPPSSHTVPSAAQLLSGSQSGQQGSFDFQKRKSVGNQRSRFLFSDPFSGTTTPTNANAPSGSIDLSDITGKSILMMESHNDAREYENLVRDPWSSQPQNAINFGSAPETPGMNVPNSFEWGVGSGSQQQQQQQQQQQPSQQQSQQQPQQGQQQQSQQNPQQQSGQQGNQGKQQQGTPLSSGAPASAGAPGSLNGERRRTSSAFFTNGSGAQSQAQPASQPSNQQQPQTVAAILSQGPTQSNGSNLTPLTIPSNSANRNGPPSASTPSGTQQNAPSSQPNSATTPTSAARSSTKDVPDLSLLARVPPPANPADQNPPCNTLYVGNLPPDATEAELRTLFSPQKGFRRLSFRTKNQSSSSSSSSSSHNHGPMCFVEFEDVAHATIALAELYGRALPRPNGSNGKGGIRLSFSKNPLGVRGPGNPRRSSSQQGSNSGTNSNVGNFGYQNFH
ncbi:hypothetical protein CXQ85_003987 [Candidozyma haemuli]|uniref:RRM domain-containing protein n=1 Tax=Candidozyma haemuli TaxID=45357 RepID=A0A2V1B0P2_9ASCO|nr:hypothetical protein CXQ85_003987 [[Candida] haemuloni]PVH23695.1 hypothetical protein CXQ85_003987 [[Candida] haemuloni]